MPKDRQVLAIQSVQSRFMAIRFLQMQGRMVSFSAAINGE